jgi:hypothetical protein
MNYLLKYYKNICEELQAQIAEIEGILEAHPNRPNKKETDKILKEKLQMTESVNAISRMNKKLK